MVQVPFPADDACLILTETFTEQFHSTVKVESPYEAGLSHDLVSFLSGPSTPSDYGGGGVKFRSFVGPLRVDTCQRWPVVSISIGEFRATHSMSAS
jgi:hypothetical protein